MGVRLFFEIILPLYEVGDSALIGISTPVDAFNFYTTLLNMTHPDTGLPLIPTYQVELICATCKQAQRIECPHMADYYPPWKSSQKQSMLRQVMGRTNLYRELYGTESESGRPVFPDHAVRELQLRPRYVCNPLLRPRNLLMTCDQNIAGPNAFALVTTAFLTGQVVIVGIESYPCRDHQERALLLRAHTEALRRRPWLADARILFCAERNQGDSAIFALDCLREFSNVVPLRQRPDKDFGWWTTDLTKLESADRTAQKLVEGCIAFSEELTVACPLLGATERERETLDEFFDQMRRYKYEGRAKKSAHGAARMTVTAKTDAEGVVREGFNDDLMITLTMNVLIWAMLSRRDMSAIDQNTQFISLSE